MRLILTILLPVIFSFPSFSQLNRIHELRNCQGEMRTATFQSQVSTIWKCLIDMANIRTQKLLKFSPSFTVDTNWLESQINKVKKTLPPGFRKDLMGVNGIGDWFDNSPDEKAIWFTVVFCQEDKNKKIARIYAAIRIGFEGTDAHLDQVRANARIRNIQFIFDKDQLNDLSKTMKSSTRR